MSLGLPDHLRRNALEAFLAVVEGGRHIDRADRNGPGIPVAGRLLQIPNLEVDPVHAGGPVVNQGGVTIAEVLDVDLLDFGLLGLEARQADFDPLVVEESSSGSRAASSLLVADQVDRGAAAACASVAPACRVRPARAPSGSAATLSDFPSVSAISSAPVTARGSDWS